MSHELPSILAHEIIGAVKKTPAGRSLEDTQRWTFASRGEPRELWKQIFGATGYVLTHSELFYGLSRSFLRRESASFTSHEKREFLLASLSHDFGEAVIDGNGVGDVEPSKKTAEMERQEVAVANYVISTLPTSVRLKRELAEAYREVVVGENSKLHLAFKALERTEYVMTAIKVFQNSERLRKEGSLYLESEPRLVGMVLANDLPVVIERYAPLFPDSIGAYLRVNENVVNRAFAHSQKDAHANGYWAKFNQSWNLYRSFLEDNLF